MINISEQCIEKDWNIYNEKSSEENSKYLLSYLNEVLIPASNDFFDLLDENQLKLHHAFSFNAILAHAIDYMVFIAKKHTKATRGNFISTFDEKYAVDGCIHINNKFSLLDAVNNSFKHVELEKGRYIPLINLYGDLSFHCLIQKQGKIFFEMPNHKFDYARVVLRPVAAIFNCDLQNTNDVDDFINGRIFGSTGYGQFLYDYEPHDAIERMIDAANPECMECGENESKCDCQKFIYVNHIGQYTPNLDPKFEFTDVISEISGTRESNKK